MLIPFKNDPNNKLLYSDTDSIVMEKTIDPKWISDNELGKFKLEHNILAGYFISEKFYCFINDKGEFIKKSKGINSNLLNLEDYISLNNGISIEK